MTTARYICRPSLWFLLNCQKPSWLGWLTMQCTGMRCTGGWDNKDIHPSGGMVQYDQVFGPVFKITAYACCSTTGDPLFKIDPAQVKHLGNS